MVRTRMAPEDRRLLILRAAADMFQKHGFGAASIDAIAVASGITGPGIYRYFRSKTDLIIALIDMAASQAEDALADRLLENGVSVSAMADVLVDAALREGAVIGLLQASVAEMDDSDRKRLEAVRNGLVSRLGQTLTSARADLDSKDAALNVQAALAIVGQVGRKAFPVADRARLVALIEAVLSA
ncbi:TetR/AcrR family transcriptional regulator [Novosphingobium aquimarinum]|uniref:TetR/AcrR family transcriptional regulator n=1 Tax=Novosphingobium aquimarinum TaxID=2682494 RepID=UPI0018DEBB01|nr:TetR/AcrR family transcriptional regulator [Novosphingobium aquimarinum]